MNVLEKPAASIFKAEEEMAWVVFIASSSFSVLVHVHCTAYSSILKTEAAGSFEKLVPFYNASHSRDHNPNSFIIGFFSSHLSISNFSLSKVPLTLIIPTNIREGEKKKSLSLSLK